MSAFIGDDDKGVLGELPEGEDVGELVFLEEGEAHVKRLANLFHVVLYQPFVFAPELFAPAI